MDTGCGARENALPKRQREAVRAADCAEAVLPLFERECPGDDRPRRAIEAARAWARGEIRVGEARAAALAAHAAARSVQTVPPACAAARAAGHAAAAAHVAAHARAAALYVDKALGKVGAVAPPPGPRSRATGSKASP